MNALSLKRLALLFLLPLVASACKEENPAFNPDPVGSGSSGGSAVLACPSGDAPVNQPFQGFADPNKLDLLFVVSTSPQSAILQQRLSDASGPFIEALIGAGMDLHVGVTNADPSTPSTFGSLRASTSPDCAPTPRILSTDEHAANLPALVACNLLQSSSSQAPPHLFNAAQAALTTRASDPDPEVGNVPFLRPDAQLAVVFLSDTDDCSNQGAPLRSDAPNNATACAWANADLTPLTEFVTVLTSLKSDQSAVFVSVLAGPDTGRPALQPPASQEQVCTDEESGALVFAAPRLAELSEIFSPDSLTASACSPFFGGALQRLQNALLARASSTLCLPSTPQGPVLRVVGPQGQELSAGQGGYLYLGPTDRCPLGAVTVDADVTQGQPDARIEVSFCAP